MYDIVTAVVDENFDVHQRLARMRGWQNEYISEDEQLQVRFRQLDANKPLDVQRGHQIGQLRKILILKQMREPLEIVVGSDQPRSRLEVYSSKFGAPVRLLIRNGSPGLVGHFPVHHDSRPLETA